MHFTQHFLYLFCPLFVSEGTQFVLPDVSISNELLKKGIVCHILPDYESKLRLLAIDIHPVSYGYTIISNNILINREGQTRILKNIDKFSAEVIKGRLII